MLLWYSMELVLYVYILQWLQSYSQGVRAVDSTSVPHPQGRVYLFAKTSAIWFRALPALNQSIWALL